MPRHLDGLELRLVRRLGVVVEAVEREHAVAQVGEPDRQRIDVRELLGERDPDVFGVGPLHGVDLLGLAILPVGLAELDAAAFLHVVPGVHRQLAHDVALDHRLAAETRVAW